MWVFHTYISPTASPDVDIVETSAMEKGVQTSPTVNELSDASIQTSPTTVEMVDSPIQTDPTTVELVDISTQTEASHISLEDEEVQTEFDDYSHYIANSMSHAVDDSYCESEGSSEAPRMPADIYPFLDVGLDKDEVIRGWIIEDSDTSSTLAHSQESVKWGDSESLIGRDYLVKVEDSVSNIGSSYSGVSTPPLPIPEPSPILPIPYYETTPTISPSEISGDLDPSLLLPYLG